VILLRAATSSRNRSSIFDRGKAYASLSALPGPNVGLDMSTTQREREAVSEDVNRKASETCRLSPYSGGANNDWSSTSILLLFFLVVMYS
jgi:hypothetical protein